VLAIVIELFRDYFCHYHMHLQWAQVLGNGMKNFLNKDYGFHLQMNNAEKIKIFNRGVDATYDITQKLILNASKSVLLLIGYAGLVLWLNWQLTLTLMLIAPFLFIGPVFLGNRVHQAQRAVSILWDHAYSFAGDSITNVLVVKLFHRVDHTEELNRNSVIAAATAQAKLSYIWAFLEAFSQGINLFLSLFVLLVSLYFYTKGLVGLGDIILFVTIANKLAAPFLQLESIYRDLVRLTADYSKYREILDLPGETDSGNRKFPESYEAIRFENVSFTYPNTVREIIKGMDFSIRRGEKVALVGHTGSGKSTVANLIMRFYLPNSGTIAVDGNPIGEFSLESYRRQFAAVFQDTTLFNDTLRANLEFVRDGITTEQIRQACRDANILEFVESLPEGFDTVVGERGLKLSGGEKQRIAIARAMLADPEVLILDEATSALDSKTEKLVSESLEKLMANRTSVIIAHRLSTIKRADRIYILDQGKVLGSGSHAELYESSPAYREMVDYQRNGFVE
jgi:ABC-type multidrug transport system fused ATPase/permease subunit